MGYAIESELLKLKTLFVSATQPIEEITEPVEKKEELEKDYCKFEIEKVFFH